MHRWTEREEQPPLVEAPPISSPSSSLVAIVVVVVELLFVSRWCARNSNWPFRFGPTRRQITHTHTEANGEHPLHWLWCSSLVVPSAKRWPLLAGKPAGCCCLRAWQQQRRLHQKVVPVGRSHWVFSFAWPAHVIRTRRLYRKPQLTIFSPYLGEAMSQLK